MNALATTVAEFPSQGRSLTAANVREHVNLIQEVMAAVMKKDTHYGVIPGCKLPSLYKAGSEVLLATFRIAVSVKVDDLSIPDCFRYRVTVTGTHQGSGIVVGEGIGECSSDEAKYRWRRCYVKQEFDATPETRRRIKFVENKQQPNKPYENMEVRTEPADLANTILKMAKKRAQIDMTLTATAASDIFTQDIEDMDDELRDKVQTSQKPAQHQATVASTPEREKLVADLYAKADEGLEALTATWAALTEEARKLVGAEFGAIKKKATAKADQ